MSSIRSLSSIRPAGFHRQLHFIGCELSTNKAFRNALQIANTNLLLHRRLQYSYSRVKCRRKSMESNEYIGNINVEGNREYTEDTADNYLGSSSFLPKIPPKTKVRHTYRSREITSKFTNIRLRSIIHTLKYKELS